MSSRESAFFVPHVHFVSTTEIANDMPNASVLAGIVGDVFFPSYSVGVF